MRASIYALSAMLIISTLAPDADARRRKRRKARSAQAAAETKIAITKLMGKFKWGMTPDAVLTRLTKKVEARFLPLIREEKDPLKQDRLRRDMMTMKKKVRKNYVKFDGTRSSWDVSFIDKEFAHKNEESMALEWSKKDRRFYFFHRDRLYKLFIAFNTELFRGKTFVDFANAMEARFGTAERKYVTTLTGESKLDHLAWPPAGGTKLKAMANTGFYGNFCLVLVDLAEEENVLGGRDLNSPQKKGTSKLVESVTSGRPDVSDDNEDIVDQITGKPSEPVASGGKRPVVKPKVHRKPGAVAPQTKKRKKNISTKDPLKDLDL
jgi:hypothetical protein